MEEKTFKVKFRKPDLKKDWILSDPSDGTYIVTSEPKKKKWKKFLQSITLGLYQAPWEYTLKPYSKENE